MARPSTAAVARGPSTRTSSEDQGRYPRSGIGPYGCQRAPASSLVRRGLLPPHRGGSFTPDPIPRPTSLGGEAPDGGSRERPLPAWYPLLLGRSPRRCACLDIDRRMPVDKGTKGPRPTRLPRDTIASPRRNAGPSTLGGSLDRGAGDPCLSCVSPVRRGALLRPSPRNPTNPRSDASHRPRVIRTSAKTSKTRTARKISTSKGPIFIDGNYRSRHDPHLAPRRPAAARGPRGRDSLRVGCRDRAVEEVDDGRRRGDEGATKSVA